MRRDESGTATLEVMIVGLLLLGPLLWALTTLSTVHRAALSASSAAREGAFEAARAVDRDSAHRALEDASVRALHDGGLDLDNARLQWSAPAGWQRGGRVEVRIAYDVPVVPAPFLGQFQPTVTVTALHVAEIDRYRSR